MRRKTRPLMLATALLPMLVASAAVVKLLSPPVYAAEYGSYSLASGQTATFRIGSTYRWLRVCNDFNSAGAVEISIGNHGSQSAGPGICVEDAGDVLKVQSKGTGPATGTYQYVSANY
ncbi:MAG: hypothetical protein QOK29_1813 [Rhodospirillaceae bacterium]|jgi:hypothetical protein|nr:hypothetical protein [Rhodospirillaceae bacterium]